MGDLFVGDFLRRAEQSVARVVDDHVDTPEGGEGFVDNAPDGRGVGHVQRGEPEPVAVLRSQVVEGSQLAGSTGDALAACEQLFGEVAAKAAADAGDEPGARRSGVGGH